MILKYLLYLFIYVFGSIDYILSIIPGISSISTYPQLINSTLSSIFGFAHNLLPSTFSMLAWYINLWFGIWISFFILKTIKRFLPLIKPIH